MVNHVANPSLWSSCVLCGCLSSQDLKMKVTYFSNMSRFFPHPHRSAELASTTWLKSLFIQFMIVEFSLRQRSQRQLLFCSHLQAHHPNDGMMPTIPGFYDLRVNCFFKKVVHKVYDCWFWSRFIGSSITIGSCTVSFGMTGFKNPTTTSEPQNEGGVEEE